MATKKKDFQSLHAARGATPGGAAQDTKGSGNYLNCTNMTIMRPKTVGMMRR